MDELNLAHDDLKDYLLDDAILHHDSYSITRSRDIFTPIKFDAELNVVNSFCQVYSGNPLNTKEAELFPGYVQVKQKAFAKTMHFIESVNRSRNEIKSFLVKRTKKTCITTDNGVVYTQNPLMYRNYPMVNTMQLYRHLRGVNTHAAKGSFIWQSNKRYLKFDRTKVENMIRSALLSPVPLNVEPKKWNTELEGALEMIERLPLDVVITKIQSTEPKPHFKFKPVGQKAWVTHYAGTPLIIANKDDEKLSIEKKMQSINVENKHKNIPVGSQWTPFCRPLHLYYQR
jgi:hypothetical protein